ncbi:MAG: C40 family peptidase [Niabella sp.]
MKYLVIILIVICSIGYYTYNIIYSPDHIKVAADTLSDGATDTISRPATAQPSLSSANSSIPLNDIVDFAETLKGTPYLYASSDPARGFDCSGFITYVFNHFGIAVPRSSVEFTNKGTEVPLQQAKRGDLILFTGTDSSSNIVGHMGIVTEHTDSLRFIHSSSGKANGVTVTALNSYYLSRFVKVITIEKGI